MAPENEDKSAGVEDAEANRRKRMLDRIYAAMEDKMLEIEARLARRREEGCEPASAADNERDVRTLNTLTRMIEKISVLTGATQGEEKTDPEAEAADADRLRDEIAERIARLRRSEEIQASHSGSGG